MTDVGFCLNMAGLKEIACNCLLCLAEATPTFLLPTRWEFFMEIFMGIMMGIRKIAVTFEPVIQ